jgi:hypothetical protein
LNTTNYFPTAHHPPIISSSATNHPHPRARPNSTVQIFLYSYIHLPILSEWRQASLATVLLDNCAADLKKSWLLF